MVFDAHSDIWTDVTIRREHGETDVFRRRHLKRLNEGKMEGAIFVIWADPPHDVRPHERNLAFMRAISEEIKEASDVLRIVTDGDGMKAAIEDGCFYSFIGVEGLSGLDGDLDRIEEFYDFGVRHVGLTWNEQNALATGVCGDPDRGLTELGKKAIYVIEDKHMLLDVSHLNEKSFWDLASSVHHPIVASHSNCRALCDVPRNLTDDQLSFIGETGGVVGVNAFGDFLDEDTGRQTAERLVDHMVHMVDVMGVEHVGMGFDFSEFLDSSVTCSFAGPDVHVASGLEDASHVPHVLDLMREVGFLDKEVAMIARLNFQRVLREVLG